MKHQNIIIFYQKVKKVFPHLNYEKIKQNWFIQKIKNFFGVFYVSTIKFIQDDCFTKASSIAYTTIVSLIPTLTVALTFYSIFAGIGDKKEEIFRAITAFAQEHNIKLNLDIIFDAISSLIQNAGKIGGIGAVVMVFSATAVLRTIERSLNTIFRATKERSIFTQVLSYWTALTLGPVLIIAGTTLSAKIYQFLSSPNYHQVIMLEKEYWAVGNKGKIYYSDKDLLTLTPIGNDRYDMDNQFIYEYESHDQSFKKMDYRLEEIDLMKMTFYDVQFIGQNGWIVGKDGILLLTKDNGKNWLIKKFGSFDLKKIWMQNTKKGFIISNNGTLFKTEDGGYSLSLIEWEDMRHNFNYIAFKDRLGVIVGDRGAVLVSYDNGENWTKKILTRKNKKIHLNSVYILDENHIWIAGDEGVIFFSSDKGKTWNDIKFFDNHFYTIYFQNNLEGYVGGEKGFFAYTKDGGKTWTRTSFTNNKILQIFPDKNEPNTIWVSGESGLLKKTTDLKKWIGKEDHSLVLFLINFFAPFVFVWLFFLLIYLTLPNVRVSFKAASLGAAFTSSIWVIFIILFRIYINSFAEGTFAIYGALASFPIFLLLVYSSAVILLYGAEVSYTLLSPENYRNFSFRIKKPKEHQVIWGFAILYFIYEKFENGKGETRYKELLSELNCSKEELDFFISLLKTEKLILETEKGHFIPANSSKNISLQLIFDKIYNIGLENLKINKKSEINTKFQSILKSIEEEKNKILTQKTLQDIIYEK